MWLSKTSGSYSRFIGKGISVCSGIGSKLGEDTRVNIDSKYITESQNWKSGSHSCSSSISWKLANLLMVYCCSSSRWCDESESVSRTP